MVQILVCTIIIETRLPYKFPCEKSTTNQTKAAGVCVYRGDEREVLGHELQEGREVEHLVRLAQQLRELEPSDTRGERVLRARGRAHTRSLHFVRWRGDQRGRPLSTQRLKHAPRLVRGLHTRRRALDSIRLGCIRIQERGEQRKEVTFAMIEW